MTRFRRPTLALLTLLMLIGLLTASGVFYQRAQAYGINRNVELALDYMAVVRAARTDGVPLDPTLTQFRQEGATTLVVRERTLFDYYEEGRVSFYYGYELLGYLRSAGRMQAVEQLQAQTVRSQDLFVATVERQLAERVQHQLELRVASKDLSILDLDGLYVVDTGFRKTTLETEESGGVLDTRASFVPAQLQSYLPMGILDIGLGIEAVDIERAASLGYNVVLEYFDAPSFDGSSESVAALFADLPALPADTRVLFRGDRLPGYPESINPLAEKIAALNLGLVTIERENPVGFDDLARQLHYDVVKMHALWPGETLQDIVIAAKDRNVRMLYNGRFNSLTNAGSVWTLNTTYIAGIRNAMERAGYQLATTRGFVPFRPSTVELLLLTVAVAASGLAVLELLRPWPLWLHVLLLVATGLGTVILLRTSLSDLLRSGVALVGTLTFPVLAFLALLPVRNELSSPIDSVNWLRASWRGLLALSGVSSVSVAGAVTSAALLADTTYTLQLFMFRGVKLSLAVPVVAVAAYYLLFTDPGKGLVDRVRRLGAWKIRVFHVVLVAVGGALILLILMRSGNFPIIPVAKTELLMRQLLEDWFRARPRTKEFLAGQPALVVAGALMSMGYATPAGLFAVLAMIGQTSLVNTFTHLHTPLSINLLRTFNGAWIGGLLGFLAVLILGPLALRLWTMASGHRHSRDAAEEKAVRP